MGDHESSAVPAESFAESHGTPAPLRIHAPEPALQVERLPVPALRLDAQGSIQDVNPATCALFGRVRDALLRHRPGPSLTPPTQTSLNQLLTTITASGQPRQVELHLLAGDDRTVDIRVDASLDHHGILLVMTDVTAYTTAHQRLLDQVADQAHELQACKARIHALRQDVSEGGAASCVRCTSRSPGQPSSWAPRAARGDSTHRGRARPAAG